MLPVPGQLAITTRRGRYGNFNVGVLTTSIGEFVTKNAELDQYKEGKYEGEFIISEIYLDSYNVGRRSITEIRAELRGMTITSIDKLTLVESQRLTPQEVDPIDEKSRPPQQLPQAAPEVSAPSAVDAPTADAPTADAPTADAPTADAPTADAPTADAPTADAPTADAPTADAPTADAPTADAPTADAPAVDPLIDTTPFGVSPAREKSQPRSHAKNAATQDGDKTLFGLLWPLPNVVKLDATVERRVYRQQISRLDALGYGFEALTQDWHRKAA